jgi:hypothetical protein
MFIFYVELNPRLVYYGTYGKKRDKKKESLEQQLQAFLWSRHSNRNPKKVLDLYTFLRLDARPEEVKSSIN